METIKNKKFLTAIVLLLLITATIMLGAYVLGLFQEITSPILPKPTPTAEATPSAKRIPSSLAIDPKFIELENHLKSLEQDLISVDLSESKLSLPILEMNINFEK